MLGEYMIVGIGTDFVNQKRIAKILARFGQRFVVRILAPSERHRYEQSTQKAAFLAKRFAVKEASAKALGWGFRGGVGFQDFTVTNSPEGQPQVHLSGQAEKRAAALGVTNIQVSISDESTHALAFVVLEGLL
jgi:holo-[acyl-carrier protein] synthase